VGEPNFINNAYDYGADRGSGCNLLLNVKPEYAFITLKCLHCSYLRTTFGNVK